MSYNKKRCIVRNSKDSFYEFHLHNGNLILESNNIGQTMLKKDILDYALDIDKNDMIHIVYFNSRGELNYWIYNDDIKDVNILTVNDEYILRHLVLKSINSSIHIFYQVDNLKRDNSYIYHNYYFKDKWIDEKVSEVCCSKYICSYFIDFYENSVYLFYCEGNNFGKYSIKKVDIDQNSWDNFDNNIIIKDVSSLNFFITPKNTAIICFSKFINNNIQTLIKYRDFNNLNSEWSSDINVSNNNTNTFKPIIFYKDNYIYVTWKQENKIVYKKSNNILEWSKEFILDVKSENLYSLVYLSNNYEQSNFKINHIYIPNVEFLYFIVNSKLDYSYDTLSLDTTNDNILHGIDIDSNSIPQRNIDLNNNCINCLQINYNQFIKEKDNYIKTLNSEIESKDSTITYLSQVNLSLRNQLNDIRNSINNYEDKLQHIKAEQALNNHKYFSSISDFEDEIKRQKEENDNILQNMNKKIQNLLKIIEEKEKIIQKLLKK